MGDSSFKTTPDADAKAHEVTVPVKTGLAITVPGGLKGTPPAPAPPVNPLDFYDWPRWLVKAVRAPGNGIVAVRASSTSSTPTLQHVADFTPEADSGSTDTAPRRFTPSELTTVTSNRAAAAAACSSKLYIGGDPANGKGGWAYNGRSPQSDGLTPVGRTDAPPHTLTWAQGLIWDDISSWEGGYASINAYDGAKLTWGQGWAMTGFSMGMQGLMTKIWTKAPAMKKSFLEHGLAWDAGAGSFCVVNDDGSMETGSSALELLVGSRDLLAIFIKVGESPALRQSLVDLEYEHLTTTPQGKPPASVVAGTEDRLIMLMGHVSHATGQSWQHKSAVDIDDFLISWSNKSWATRKSGAKTWASGQVLNNLQHWGRGIAWTDAISKVSPGVAPGIGETDIDNDANKLIFGGLLAIWDPAQKGYHFYPRLPTVMVFDEELYHWVQDHGYFEIKALLKAAQDLGARAKGYRDTYDASKRTIASFGYRARVALDAALAKKAGQSAHTKLYADQLFKDLPGDQRDEIRKFLGDKAMGPWDYWDSHEPGKFYSITIGYSMDAMISTYGARGRAMADTIRQKYDEMGQPNGSRAWIAMMAAYNKGGGTAAGWIVNHPGYRGLFRDQRISIRKTVGLPYSKEVMDAEGIDT